MKDLIIITLLFDNDTREQRVTTEENLEKCISATMNENFYIKSLKTIHVNKAVMCFDGYLVQDEFIKQIQL